MDYTADAISLRPSGIGRYFSAAFLTVWLTGWVIGEVVAASVLISILIAAAGYVSEHAPNWGADMVRTGGAAFAIFFLVAWLTLWTIGGAAALTHLVRSLAGEDIVAFTAEGFDLVRRGGPFRRRTTFARQAVRRLRVRSHDGALVADTVRGTQILTAYGSRDDRQQLHNRLSHHLNLSRAALAGGVTPANWDVRRDGDTSYLCKIRPRPRAVRSIFLWLLTAAVAMAWSASRVTDGSGNLPALVLTVCLATCSVLSMWARREWVVRTGELSFRWSLVIWSTERVFHTARLDLTTETDSDNDSHYQLTVIDADGRKMIYSQMNDSGEVTDLALWLAAHTGFPFASSVVDRASTARSV